MHHRFTSHLTALAVAALVLFGAGQALAAGGTDAGETISNSATLSYQVGSVTPPSITSDPAEFVVDYKIDPVVVKDGDATVVPNGTGYALKFTVTNNSNTKAAETLQLKLTTEVGVRDFDMDNIKIFADDGATAGTFDGSDTEITASNPFISLAKDAAAVIYIVADAPGTALDSQTASYHLIATAWTGGADGVPGAKLAEDSDGDDAGTQENVFVDAAGSATVDADIAADGKHSAFGTYTVVTARLTIGKASAVIGGTGYYIPGETVEYTITISNAAGASATATDISVSDSLDIEITAGTVAFVTDSIKVTAPNINGGAGKDLSDAVDADEGQFAANTVTVTDIALAAGESATVKFRVTIQ